VLESVDLHLVRDWFKVAIKSVNENFMKNCFDEAGNSIALHGAGRGENSAGELEGRKTSIFSRSPRHSLRSEIVDCHTRLLRRLKRLLLLWRNFVLG